MTPSAPASDQPDWTARLISPDDDFAGAPLLRREFVLEHGSRCGHRRRCCTPPRTGCSRRT